MDAGWYPDPERRYEHRWWHGTGWSDHVSDHGTIRQVAPLDPPPPPRLPAPPPGPAPVTVTEPRPQVVERANRSRSTLGVLLVGLLVLVGGISYMADQSNSEVRGDLDRMSEERRERLEEIRSREG